jgi:hypothetical protein
LDSQSPILSLWSRKTSLSHDWRSDKSKLHLVSAINQSLSTSGIFSRSTGGGRNKFSSPFACLDFGAISAIVLAIKHNVSGVTDCG